ncbi:uncharacterized protein RAG0_00299 [Rhynchosporium agropyri]|uniref:Uncharacterized protein n=1 Tax=Rhynchosporium agropyri TaxID=914238 RepID=A0A1E1JRU1_9HELO|nr:uncharacterized protein RAG0_00299 [Rhynchosporium agropyri]
MARSQKPKLNKPWQDVAKGGTGIEGRELAYVSGIAEIFEHETLSKRSRVWKLHAATIEKSGKPWLPLTKWVIKENPYIKIPSQKLSSWEEERETYQKKVSGKDDIAQDALKQMSEVDEEHWKLYDPAEFDENTVSLQVV